MGWRIFYFWPNLAKLRVAHFAPSKQAKQGPWGAILINRYAKLAEKIGGEVYYPRTEFCTDNGAMIAFAGMQRLKNGEFSDLSVKATPRWPIDQLSPID